MVSQPQRIVTGIRATGHLHLGNYFGALKTCIELQERKSFERYLFIADYHTLTTETDAHKVRRQVLDVGRELLAAGIEPEKTTLYLQSAVEEIAELGYLLANVAFKGELERVATFKEKARKQPDNVNLALLSYPVLMSADVLGLGADKVPVGDDQTQHMELMRDFSHRFNHRYGQTFTEPTIYSKTTLRVPALDGSGKMGKSEGNALSLLATDEEIEKAIKQAPTDTGKGTLKPGAKALFELVELFDRNLARRYQLQRKEGTIRYTELKADLVGLLKDLIGPIRKRADSITDRHVLKVLRAGSTKVKPLYKQTLARARTHMGLLNPLQELR